MTALVKKRFVEHDGLVALNEEIGIVSKIDSLYSQQEEIAIYLHSHLAPQNGIQVKHAERALKVSEIASAIDALRIMTCRAREQLPFFRDRKIIAAHWTSLSIAEFRLFLMAEQNQELLLLLKSPKHKKALMLCKKAMKEFAAGKGAREAYQEEIRKQQEGLRDLDPRLLSKINELHQEMQQFMAGAIPGPIPAPTDAQAAFFDTCKTVALKKERYFRKGEYWRTYQWRDLFLRFTYPTIYPQIIELEEVAKRLQKIEEESWHVEKGPLNTSCLDFLEQQVDHVKAKLYSCTAPTEVPNGLHFAASQYERIRQVRRFVQYAATLPPEEREVKKVEVLLAASLSPEARIGTLVEATLRAEVLTSSSRAIRYIDNALAKWGPTLTALNDAEQEAMKQLFSSERPAVLDKEVMKSLLSKKLLSVCYFSKEPVDPELDRLLDILRTSYGSFLEELELGQLLEKRRSLITR